MHAVLRDPEAWWATARTRGLTMLQQAWVTAGQDLPVQDNAAASRLAIDLVTDVPGVEALVITLPPPEAPSECYFIALVRAPGQVPRYFLAERGVDAGGVVARAFWAEWRQAPNGAVMRIHGEDLAQIHPHALVAAAAGECLAAVAAAAATPTTTVAPTPTPTPPQTRGLVRRLIFPVVTLVLLAGGGFLYYQEEVRGLHVPGPEVVSVAVEPNKPFTVQFKWEGTGYAFNNLWLVVDAGTRSSGDFKVKSTVRCREGGAPDEHTIGLSDRGVHDNVSTGGDGFSAWLFLADEYRSSSSALIECSGTIEPLAGTWSRARVVVTQRQRPSDFIAG